MARKVEPWTGKNDDTAIPDRVRLRVFKAKLEKCHRCGRQINAAIERWTLEHLIALINWLPTAEQPHGNIEANLDLTCCNCLPAKNAEDQAEKSAVYTVAKKHKLPKTDGRRTGFRKMPTGYRWDWSKGRAVKA